MKNLYKVFVGFAVLLFCFVLFGTEKAEAAQIVDAEINGASTIRTYTVWDLDELDWSSWLQTDKALNYADPENMPRYIAEKFNYWIVLRNSSGHLIYLFFDYEYQCPYVPTGDIRISYSYSHTLKIVISNGVVLSVMGCEDYVTNNTSSFETLWGSGSYGVGSNYDYMLAEGSETSWANKKRIIARSNLVIPGKSYCKVTIPVNGVDYTISEPYPYYFGLKHPNGSIRLFFSDSPFTGSMADLYNRQFQLASNSNVVWYYWDSVEQNDFLNSRTSSIGFDAFLFQCSGDYMCNYSIPQTDNPLYFFLSEKLAFDVPEETLSVKDLYSALPDELSKYYHIIIFRQDSPNAFDNRILFYGWNDNNANLYIHSSNSQIAALNKKGLVSDYATAYYDEELNTWVVSSDVVLGATTDASYNVPFIYHSDLDLFVCDEWNVWNGQIAYPGDDNRPLVSFEEPEEDEDTSLLESILNGFKKLFVSLFVPSEGFFTSKVNEISSNFGFWTSVRDTAAIFIDFLKETDFTEPPKVQIDLSSINSIVDYGGKVYILDFSWYEPYKESVDVILSAIIWLVFAWNTYKNLPSIISGISGGVQATASILTAREE